jgi:putative FmdB family regulatory protein
MPTYVYECPQCGYQTELIRKTEDRDNHVSCHCIEDKETQPKMKRVPAPTSFILKGPGWAKDGYSK